MVTTNLPCPLSITHIGTATTLLHLDGITILTDPVFSPAGTEFNYGGIHLITSISPALTPQDLPPIDLVLLSHEDHPDNLDPPGRLLLDGRRVLTTTDGTRNLAPRPGVVALKPWQTVAVDIGSRRLGVTATPARHLPGGEAVGFVVTCPEMGSTEERPNAVYFTGDTVFVPELLPEMRKRWHIAVVVVNLGDVHVPAAVGEKAAVKITMDGHDAVKLFRGIGADVLVPVHYEGGATLGRAWMS